MIRFDHIFRNGGTTIASNIPSGSTTPIIVNGYKYTRENASSALY